MPDQRWCSLQSQPVQVARPNARPLPETPRKSFRRRNSATGAQRHIDCECRTALEDRPTAKSCATCAAASTYFGINEKENAMIWKNWKLNALATLFTLAL